ncbi:hypothetical protein CsSME_00049619 [Camellia sinensis var. sinensis]|uniref:PWWP domain-containing protein n=1 Tax=Camellia sinensis TaxID=4442 RepID=A0A7J7G912_CAMSI|nr:hypothetical protein HYC85_027077 [Camellia sinensis]
MGISEIDCRVGTLVWVQRKNGSWWPGRVVELTEFSPSHLTHRRACTPVKLLGREDSSVDWYNLEKSKRIKAFRCGEFDDCIERAESSHANFSKKIVKYARREDAILHALELEKQEVQRKHKAAGKEWSGIICQAKRSRRVYLPAESNNCWKRTAFRPKPLQVSTSKFEMRECPQQSGSAEDNNSSRSMESDSSESDSQGPDRVQRETQLSDAAILVSTQPSNSGKYDGQPGNMNGKGNHELNNLSDVPLKHLTAAEFGIQKRVHIGKENICNLTKRQLDVIDVKNYVKFKKRIHNNGETLTSSAALAYHSITELDTKPGENSVWVANTLSQSTPVYIGFSNRMETTLTDVELKVQASYREDHVPLVSLMSGLNRKAIVGHPIDIEASDDGSSEILLARKHEIGHKLLDNNGSTMLRPAWRTSRRTRVCYVPQSHTPSTLNDAKYAQAYQNSGHLSLKAGANSLQPTKDIPRKPNLVNLKTRTISSFDTEQKLGGNEGDLQPISQGCMIDRQLKAKDMPTRVTCVPVKLIFSKLLVAVGRVQS